VYHRIKDGDDRVAVNGTVAEFGERWIDVSLKTRRTERGVQDTRSRFHRLFQRFAGHLPDRLAHAG
jgi:hypothetical protein